VASAHDAVFCADAVHHLIVRLRHNVIRAGLRRMSLAYSRISLADVAAKLGLASVQDTESIVAKAIRWARAWLWWNFVCILVWVAG
jgi:26S proteasome regulatory subunit N3